MRILLTTLFLLLSTLAMTQGCIAPGVQSNSIGQTSATMCASGGSITLTIPGFTSNSVIWYYSATVLGTYTVVPGHFTQTETFTNPGYYKYYQTTSACGTSQSPALNVNGISSAPVAPSFSSSSPIICGGVPVNLNATPNDAITAGYYFYSSPSNIQVTNSVSTAGDYYATAINVCGASPASNIVTLTTGTIPSQPTITLPSLPLCNSGSGTLTANGSGGTYNWYNSANTNVWTGGTYSVNTADTYTVDETNGCGTSPRSNGAVITTAVTPAAPAAPTLVSSGGGLLCNGMSTTLTASGGNGNYVWNTAQTGSQITTTVAGSYYVYCLPNSNACGSSAPSGNTTISISTNVLPPAPVISSSNGTILCDLATTNISTTPSAGGTILWSTGAITNNIVVSTAGTFTAQETNGCGTGPASNSITTTTANHPFVIFPEQVSEYLVNDSLLPKGVFITSRGDYVRLLLNRYRIIRHVFEL